MKQSGYNTGILNLLGDDLMDTTAQMAEITKRIKARREYLGLSYQQLGELTGMSKSTLQRYETGGIKNIPLDRLEVLANALQTTPEWILGWNQEMGEFDKTTHEHFPNSKNHFDGTFVPTENTAQNETEKKILLLARHLEKIPEEKRERIIRNFEDTIDTYLDAMGIVSKEDE